MTSERAREHAYELVRQKERYLSDLLQRFSDAQRLIPFVQEQLEIARWQCETLETYIDDPGCPLPDDIVGTLTSEYSLLERELPQPPRYRPKGIDRLRAFTSAGTVSIADHMDSLFAMGGASAPSAQSSLTKYQSLARAQRLPGETRQRLAQLPGSQTVSRFDRAVQAVTTYRSGGGQKTAAASEVRNLLDGVKGDLFQRARQNPRENMTWPKMARRLAAGGEGSADNQELVRLGLTYDSLYEKLSQLAKDRPAPWAGDLNVLWMEALDLISSLLGLVKATS